MEPQVLGVLGGMGPEAAIEFCMRLVRLTPAKSDQDHIPVILINDPRMPDRTPAIMQGGPSPLPHLIKIARQLEKAGADLIAIPCNTAHYWYDQLTEAVDTPIINIIEATVAQLRRLAGKELVGLLATDGTLSSKLYQGVLEEHGIPFITPNSDDQKHVMEVVYSIKEHGVTAELRTKIRKVAENLVDAGARAVITGCTELPLALDPSYDTLEVPVADSLTALAEMVLDLMRPDWRDKRSTRKGKK